MATPLPSASRSTRGSAYSAFLVVSIAAGLRLFHLGYQGLFLDEAWSWATALLPINGILEQMQADLHPPLYFFFLKAWLAFFPATHVGLRSLSAVFSIAALLLLILITRRWYGDAAGWLAGWWLAFSSFDIYYAQETRMYTMLSLLFLLAYISLFEALRGKTAHWVAWAIALMLMTWTHLYGLIFTGVHLAFLLGLWIASRFIRNLPILPKLSYFAAFFAGTGVIPIAWMLFRLKDSGAGGAWIPSLADVVSFYTLAGSGAASARVPFLNGNLLVWPAFAGLPQMGWVLISVLAWAWFVCAGLHRAWRRAGLERLRAILAIIFLVLPVGMAGFAILTARPQWAFKPFLGVVYLGYMWAGIGLSGNRPMLRSTAALGVVLVSLVTLLPYYSIWYKTNVDTAFSSLPAVTQSEAILLERSYEAPLVFYYRPAEAEVWGMANQPGGTLALLKVLPPGVQPGNTRYTTCDDPRLQEISRMWVYGDVRFVSDQQLPTCIQDMQFYQFKYPNWVPISSQ